MSSMQLSELHDRTDAGTDERRGFCHISEVLAELLAKIPVPDAQQHGPLPEAVQSGLAHNAYSRRLGGRLNYPLSESSQEA